FDTGPGNMVIDAIITSLTGGRETFDRDGGLAAQGTISEKLLAELMSHPFLRRRPPKTTGREEFGEPFVRSVLASSRRLHLRDADLVATVTAFTAASIAQAYRRFVFPRLSANPKSKPQVILGGGGVRNHTLCRMLKEQLDGAELFTHEDFGIANASKEALAFAILAHETLQGQPGNVPNATGARRPV